MLADSRRLDPARDPCVSDPHRLLYRVAEFFPSRTIETANRRRRAQSPAAATVALSRRRHCKIGPSPTVSFGRSSRVLANKSPTACKKSRLARIQVNRMSVRETFGETSRLLAASHGPTIDLPPRHRCQAKCRYRDLGNHAAVSESDRSKETCHAYLRDMSVL